MVFLIHNGFEYLRNKFPNVNDAKIKEGIFIGRQIRELMQDKQFDEDLNETERNAWLSFNPSAWGHLNPSSYCDVERLFYGVFKLWSKLQRKK